MTLSQWQHRFECWLEENHATDDAAHDISHFRRVWMTAQRIMVNQTVDHLVVSRRAIFMTLLACPKTIRNAVSHLS
jgi:uncharacterized protein